MFLSKIFDDFFCWFNLKKKIYVWSLKVDSKSTQFCSIKDHIGGVHETLEVSFYSGTNILLTQITEIFSKAIKFISFQENKTDIQNISVI